MRTLKNKYNAVVEYQKENLEQVNPQLHKSLGIFNSRFIDNDNTPSVTARQEENAKKLQNEAKKSTREDTSLSRKALVKENELLKKDIDNLREMLKLQGKDTGGKLITIDGLTAVIDHSDANHIAHKAGRKKAAQIAKANKLIDAAVPYAEDANPEHNKFNYFKYYKANARLFEDEFSVFFNVGRTKNDGTMHLYHVTERINNDTAHLLKGVDGLREFPSGSGIVYEDNTPTLPRASRRK